MNAQTVFKSKLLLTSISAVLVGVLLFWEHNNGGVITHHLLARKDMPGFSNWWGLLTIPLLAWISLSLIQRRITGNVLYNNKQYSYAIKGFLLAFTFGLVLTILWQLNMDFIMQYLIFLPLILALFLTVHLPEHLLGFVVGMGFSFGGILPIIIGSVLLAICFVINKVIRRGILFIIGIVTSKES